MDKKTLDKKIIPHTRGSYDLTYFDHTIDDLIKDFMDEHGLEGLQLSTVQAPYIPTSRGYGIANSDATNSNGVRKIVGTRTIYGIGGISMAYNSVALIQAYEQKLLNLDDPITKYIPLGDAYDKITLLALMRHTSLINDFRAGFNYNPSKKYSDEEIIKFIKEVGISKNNEDVLLSPSNNFLIAKVIEQVSKMPYETFVRTYQLEKVGVKDTYFYDELKNIKEDIVDKKQLMHKLFKEDPHFINPAELAKGDPASVYDPNLIGFSDLFASAQDISVWDIGLAGSILTNNYDDSKLIYKPFKKDDKTIYASGGWEFTQTDGFMDIYGSNGGYTSYLSRFTSLDTLICVTLQTNKANVDFTELGRNIANAIMTKLGAGVDPSEVYAIDSYKPFDATYESIKHHLKQRGFTIFSEIDHEQNAKDVKMQTLPNKVILFGNPKGGTKLINANHGVGLMLPLKIQVYEDEVLHNTWISTPNLYQLARIYHISDLKTIKKIYDEIKDIIHISSRNYQIH